MIGREGGEMSKRKPVEEFTFEEAYSELQALVLELEAGDQPLEDSLRIYERGQALAGRCTQLLEEAELKLEELTPKTSSDEDV
jgi:exodeoxyribonuclease VII small subunit